MSLLYHIFLLSLYNWLEHLYCIAFGVFWYNLKSYNKKRGLNLLTKLGSIIFVVGKSPMDIMEPILCRKKVP